MRWVVILAAAPLLAQQQPTFHAAWMDGLEAERAGRWAEAEAAFRRAIELRPTPSARVVIYGNNLLTGYYPRTHLARCLLEQGKLEAAEAELQKASHEPAEGREALQRRIQDQRSRALPGPAPVQPEREPAPGTARPAPALPPPVAGPEEVPAAKGPHRPEPAPPPDPAPGNPAPSRETLPQPGPSSSHTGPAGPQPPPPAPPPPEPSRPLPWIPLGLGAGLLALALAWRRSTRRARLERRGHGQDPGFAPGALPGAVGPYRVERLLGRGGFADTFLAHHEQTGLEVALKVPHLHRVDDAEFRLRFHQEARLGARLDHPHLVRILDPGLETGRPYLAMEYLPGQSLEARLKEDGALPLPEALAIALDVAGAMAHAHTHGVVHRDLKPGNIMLTGQGAKVMDLGIARIMDSATVTTTYAFLGTPLYAAPEAQFKTHVGPAADRYSLGVLLFHMVTGTPPFQGETPFEILHHHRSDPPPDLLESRPDAPPALSRLVCRLLDKEPDQRPDDGEILRLLAELAADLRTPPAVPPEG